MFTVKKFQSARNAKSIALGIANISWAFCGEQVRVKMVVRRVVAAMEVSRAAWRRVRMLRGF
jgi:hypothetical protein